MRILNISLVIIIGLVIMAVFGRLMDTKSISPEQAWAGVLAEKPAIELIFTGSSLVGFGGCNTSAYATSLWNLPIDLLVGRYEIDNKRITPQLAHFVIELVEGGQTRQFQSFVSGSCDQPQTTYRLLSIDRCVIAGMEIKPRDCLRTIRS